MSALGSSTIVYKVITNFRRSKPYDRLLLGLSSCDIVASMTYMLSPFLLPQQTSHRVWAVGNDMSCTMLGFFTQFSFSAIWYNCMLSFYYLLTVRFGIRRQTFADRIEPWMHFATLLFNISTSSYGAVIGLFGELGLNIGCWVSSYPPDCVETGEPCIGYKYGWVMAGLPFIVALFAIPINNLIVYCHVRKRLRMSTTRTSTTATSTATNNNNNSSNRLAMIHEQQQQERERMLQLRHDAQIREVASQGVLYVGTFMFCMLPALLVRVLEAEPVLLTGEDEPEYFWLLSLNNIFLPLQGFLNMFVYTRPNYLRLRGAYPNQTMWWSLRRACLDNNIPRWSESRWSVDTNGSSHGGSSRRLVRKISRSSKKNYSGASAFSSDLDIVVEGSEEDKSSSLFMTPSSTTNTLKRNHWDDVQIVYTDILEGGETILPDEPIPQECSPAVKKGPVPEDEYERMSTRDTSAMTTSDIHLDEGIDSTILPSDEADHSVNNNNNVVSSEAQNVVHGNNWSNDDDIARRNPLIHNDLLPDRVSVDDDDSLMSDFEAMLDESINEDELEEETYPNHHQEETTETTESSDVSMDQEGEPLEGVNTSLLDAPNEDPPDIDLNSQAIATQATATMRDVDHRISGQHNPMPNT